MEYLIYSIIHVVLGIVTIIMIIKSEGKDCQKMTYLEAFGIIIVAPLIFILTVIGYLSNKKIN